MWQINFVQDYFALKDIAFIDKYIDSVPEDITVQSVYDELVQQNLIENFFDNIDDSKWIMLVKVESDKPYAVFRVDERGGRDQIYKFTDKEDAIKNKITRIFANCHYSAPDKNPEFYEMNPSFSLYEDDWTPPES